MSVPPLRWTGLLLAFLVLPPPEASAQAVGRVVRHTTTNESTVASRAIGAGTFGRARSDVKASNSIQVQSISSSRVAARASMFGTVVSQASEPADEATIPAGIPVQNEVELEEPEPPTNVLTWKPGGIRVTGWTEEPVSDAYATVNRPDCEAEGLNASCVPDDLYALPPTSEPAQPIVVALPFTTQIYPLSYAYYYGLPFPPLALRSISGDIGPTPCNPPQQTPTRKAQQQRRRSSRLFGWLYRSVRNVDMEKSSAPALFYLRSPLLAGFADDMDCPPETDALESSETCATITVRAEKDAARVAQVALPLLDADDSAELRTALETRLNAGEAVVMSTLDGKALLLTPNHVRELDVRPCVPVEPDFEDEDRMPTFAY